MPLIIIGMLASSLSILLEVVGCPKDRFAEEIFFFVLYAKLLRDN